MTAPVDKSADDARAWLQEGNGNLAARHRRRRASRSDRVTKGNHAKLKIGILLGDDIGLEVVPEAVKVMKAAAAKTGLAIEWHELPIGKAGHEQHGNTLPKITEETLHTLDGWIMGPIGHNAYPRGDMTWVMPPVRKKFDLFTALRPALSHPTIPVGAQERRHRVLPRTDRGHALFRDRGRGPARVPAERRHHHLVARHHPQGLEPRRPRGLRARPHAAAQEGHRRAQGAGLSARLRHVRRGMPQGREGLSGRAVRGDDDRLDRDEARRRSAALRRGRHHQPVRRHPHRHRRGPRRRARPRARPLHRREAGDGAGDPRLGARHLPARTSPIPMP